MSDRIKWSVVLVCPGEEELALLAELSARRDTRVHGIVDPDGSSLGAGLSEVLQLPVFHGLEDLPDGLVKYIIHPVMNDRVAPFVDAASSHGMTPVTAATFQALMVKSALTGDGRPRQLKPKVHLDFLEAETTSIHRTLSRIEEALDRESLLKWLLGLATRATGADSGSIMLYDEAAGELYVAFAHGLSQTTMHRTRLKLGEGVAGRVATTGKAEFLRDTQHPGLRRDRSDIGGAICAPIHCDNRLLGVINVSTTDASGQLAPTAMDIVGSLTHRFGLILDRFLRLQAVNDGEIIQKLERRFSQALNDPDNAAIVLSDWAASLQELAGAHEVSFSLVTSDGDLLTADTAGLRYESPPPDDKSGVLASGNPVVLRPQENGFALGEGSGTVYHLPIGREPARALMSIGFNSHARAHAFHIISPEVLFTVGRHLKILLDRLATDDQLDRLTTLASSLSDLATYPGNDPASIRQRLLTAACHLTGAGQASLLHGQTDQHFCDGAPLSDVLRVEATRLLHDAGTRGWQSTILTIENGDGDVPTCRSIMVVPLEPGETFPGLVLVDKTRLQPLDGATFTEFDALFVQRLLPLLAKPTAEVEFIPAGVDSLGGPANPTVITAATACAVGTEDLLDILHREIDRCDRYHNMLGVVGFRVIPPTGPAPEIPLLVEFLAQKLRSSDMVGWLTDGTIVAIVPEDIQSLPQLQKRVTTLLIAFTGQDDLVVQTASRVFPGGGSNATELLASLQAGLNGA